MSTRGHVQQPGLDETAEGVLEGGTGDAVPIGELSLRRQIAAGGVAPVEDVLAQPRLQDIDDGLAGQRLQTDPPA